MNDNHQLSFNYEELSHIFPFYLMLNKQLEIESWGKSMAKLFPNLKVGCELKNGWTIFSKEIDLSKKNYLDDILNKLVVLSENSNHNLKFKGQFELLANEEKYIFLGSPWFNNTDQLLENHLNINDFALHDSMTDLLHVLKNNEIANEELKEILKKVNHQKKALELDQIALLKKEKMLHAIAEATEELLSNIESRNAIKKSLELIGKAIEIDRICIYTNYSDNKDNVFSSLKYDWINERIKSKLDTKHEKDIVFHKLDSLLLQLKVKQIVEAQLSNLQAGTLKRIMNIKNIRSLLIIPIFAQDSLWGFISFNDYSNERIWTNDERSLLKSFANSISSAIERNESSKEVYKMALFSLENPDPVIRINTKGEVLLRNKASERLLYLEINGKKRSDTVLFKYLAKTFTNGGNQMVFEGKYNDLFYQTTARKSENQDTINIYLSNITKQKEAENAILVTNEQLKLFKSLINNSSDAVQVSYENGQLFYVNKTASERLGIPEDRCGDYHVKDFESIFENEALWNAHVEELKRVEFLLIEGENVNQQTGFRIPVEVTVKYINLGGVGFIMANSRDVTERKQNEKQLKIQEEKYRNIIANMNLGLLEVDDHEIIQFANQSFCDMSGYELVELMGKNASTLFSKGENATLVASKSDLRIKGISDAYEIATKNKRGELKWWLVSGAPRYNDDGEYIGTVGIHLDITAQKMIEEELVFSRELAEQSSKAKEAFLANMSHEIRTPLNGIIGMIRELGKENLSMKQYGLLDSAQKASSHLLSIINNILDFSKIEAGELKLDQFHFDLQDVLNDVKKIMGSQAAKKEINLEIQFDKSIYDVFMGDAARIRQILLNLTSNAIKFTEKGFVRVECLSVKGNRAKQMVEFRITDSGIGMDEAYVKRIFNKFQQEDISNSRKYGGTGLGMVITKELIDLMEGTIQIESEKGKGTEIIIQLALPIGDKTKIEKVEKVNTYESLAFKSILLVEDNEMNRLVATNALLPYKLEVTEAENGEKAIELLQKEQFDLILMDIQMPVMGGLEATKIIREDLKIKTPIIALTANAFRSEIEKCLASGMNNFVIKPFEEKDLLKVIEKEIGDKKSVKESSSALVDANETTVVHYNLTKLKEISRGNKDFVLKMLNLFVETVPKSIVEMEEAFEKGDVDTIKKVAHKLKPPLQNLTIEVIHEEIRALEKFDSHEDTYENLSAMVKKTLDVLRQTVESIRKNELN